MNYWTEKSIELANQRNYLDLLYKVYPIKGADVAYLKRDQTAIERHPHTMARRTEKLFENWINRRTLGCEVTKDPEKFLKSNDNIIYNTNDAAMAKLASEHLGYARDKGLDFIGKFNNTYILGEAKFLTDFGGHQYAQFEDAVSTMRYEMKQTDNNVKVISILDGVLYIPGKHKMYQKTTESFKDDEIIISAVLLRDYLYSL